MDWFLYDNSLCLERVNKDISHLDNALSNILANTLKEQKKLFLSHLFRRFIFVDSIQQPLVPGNIYCLNCLCW